MSYTGDATGTPTGEPEEFLIGFVPIQIDGGSAAILPIRPAPGCGNEFFIYGADQKAAGVAYIVEGARIAPRVALDPNKAGQHSYFCEALGSWSDAGSIDYLSRVLFFQSEIGGSEQIDFDVSSQVVGSVGDGLQFSGWSLSGVQRWANCRPHEGSKFEGELDVTLTDSGGTRTVNVLLGPIVLATGSRSGDGAITLAAVGGSGVSGAVTVAWTADVLSGCVVVKRWAASYLLAVNSTPAILKTINDPGIGERLSVILGPIAVGSYTLTITPTSDTGSAGTAGTASVVVTGPPLPPTNLRSNGTTASYADVGPLTTFYADTELFFQCSLTPGATYRVYDIGELDGPTLVTVIAATRAAGPFPNAAVTLALPQIVTASGSFSFPPPADMPGGGERWIKLVAFDGTNESEPAILMLKYNADGTEVVDVPNTPTIRPHGSRPVSSGRAIALDYIYDASGEAAAGTQIVTRIQKLADASIVTNAAVVMGSGTVKTGSLSLTAGADGFFRVSAAAQTAGAVQGAWSDWTDWIYCSSAAVPAAGNIVVTPVA